jgi:hypothetical protein
MVSSRSMEPAIGAPARLTPLGLDLGRDRDRHWNGERRSDRGRRHRRGDARPHRQQRWDRTTDRRATVPRLRRKRPVYPPIELRHRQVVGRMPPIRSRQQAFARPSTAAA